MSRVWGAALRGVDGVAVEVEVRISSQLPRVEIVGLAEAAVREAAARVRGAIASVGQTFPDRRITVNLAPAGLPKSGAALDLPIAVGILAAAGCVENERLEALALIGELALDGRLRPVRGSLALALAALDAGCQRALVPADNGSEAALARDLEVFTAPDLGAVLRHLVGGESLPRASLPQLQQRSRPQPDMTDVRGQERAKRALEVAAAGSHALLLRGAPGCGKTMLARRLSGLLPPLEFAEAVEVTRIHSAAGQLHGDPPFATERPFRAPHHTASSAGLLGGGNPPSAGEVSLAHRGVLFLDELPEFGRRTLEALRQVIESHRVVVARARASCTFPADFQLIAAANPCPCGWRGSPQRDCRCDDGAVARYAARVSGPLLDRIDLQIDVDAVPWRELERPGDGPGTAEVRQHIVAARRFRARSRAGQRMESNARLPDDSLDDLIEATPEARQLLGRAVDRLALSARGARKVLKVARTIADLAGERKTGPAAVAEALSYRGSSSG